MKFQKTSIIRYNHTHTHTQVAASLVLCTFFSAPIMYLSARMILVVYPTLTHEDYDDVIQDCRRDVSIVTCISVVSGVCCLHRGQNHIDVLYILLSMSVKHYCQHCALGVCAPFNGLY